MERSDAIAIIQEYLRLAPAFRSKPCGAPNSQVRAEQDAHIALEDRARSWLTRAGVGVPFVAIALLLSGCAHDTTPAGAVMTGAATTIGWSVWR